jgi:hypothetical protein
MRLLEHGADVDDSVDIFILTRVFPDRGLLTLGEEIAELAKLRTCGSGIARPGKDVDAKAPVGLADVAEVNGLGIGKTDDRRRVEALANDEPLGEILVGVVADQKLRAIVRRSPRGVASVLDEIALKRCRVRPAIVMLGGEQRGKFAVEVDQLLGDRPPFLGVGVQQARRTPAVQD